MDLICGSILAIVLLGGLFAALTRKSRIASADDDVLRVKYPEGYPRRKGLDFHEPPFVRG